MADDHSKEIATLEREYSPSSCIDDIAPFLHQYDVQSRDAIKRLGKQSHIDVKYGPEPRAALDIFVPRGDGPFPVHVFIHGGYWQELSKAESRFAAPNFIDHEVMFIALDYTLAPAASLFQIVDQVRRGVLWILERIAAYGGDPANITLSGSSAGAHLVAEILSSDWRKAGYSQCPVRGACAVSGIYDLRPLVPTYINAPLKLSEEDAAALSPLFHIPRNACPVIFSYGENETPAFKKQTRDYRAAWRAAGHAESYIDMPGFNHFDVILQLNNRRSPLFQAILAQISQ